MSTIIRKMTRDDKESVIEMMRAFYTSPAVFTNGSEEIFEADVEHCVNDCPYLEGYVFEDLYMKPEYRGLGIETKFFEFLDQTYTDCLFRLEVEEENERAIHVYEKNGFSFWPYMEMKKNRES